MSLALKCGACLEYGCERMSATTSIPCCFNRPTNFAAEWLEWPIVKMDHRPELSPFSFTDCWQCVDG